MRDPPGCAVSHGPQITPLSCWTWSSVSSKSPEGGWGIDGHANTGADIVAAARAALQSEAS
jgi:hypothetical protein